MAHAIGAPRREHAVVEVLLDREPTEPITLIELEPLSVEPPADQPVDEAFRLLALQATYVVTSKLTDRFEDLIRGRAA